MLGIGSTNVSETLQVQAKTELTNNILEDCSSYLKGSQLMELNKTLNKHFQDYEIFVVQDIDLHKNYVEENQSLLSIYIGNKKLEGLSPRTLSYYEKSILQMLEYVNKPLSDITTDDLREYLASRQESGTCSNVTLDSIRRNLNTFFNTMSNEGYIRTNPMVKIKKIKSVKKVKKPFTELEIEKMRGVLNSLPENTKYERYLKLRDNALFELLLSSGIRLRECVQLNKSDINLEDRSFVVLGKGNKERTAYFSVKCQYHLKELFDFENESTVNYLEESPLFKGTYGRFGLNGVERRIRELGNKCGVKAHPHKFRRTFATTLVNKGVPIEQIKELLGHANIDTTMIYAIVDQDQVRYNHNKYAG